MMVSQEANLLEHHNELDHLVTTTDRYGNHCTIGVGLEMTARGNDVLFHSRRASYVCSPFAHDTKLFHNLFVLSASSLMDLHNVNILI